MSNVSRAVNIADLRLMARRRLPKAIFDYVDGGAEDELSLRANRRAFEDVTFRPRHAVAVPEPDLRVRVLGHDLALPVLLGPVGYNRMMHPKGECAAARAAGAAGTIYILSTVSGHRLEDVKAASTGPVWYQLYLTGGRDAAKAGIERARAAGFSALVITVDTYVAGMRERDVHNGTPELLSPNVLSKLPYLPQFLAHPAWLVSFLLDGGVHRLPNIVVPGEGPLPLVDVSTALSRVSFTWEDLSWIRPLWPGPIIIKGVLTGDDARRAVDGGAAAVVVSNHGGRQLDSSPATLRVLPEVVAAVNGRAEVLIDGGIRRGADVVKAICLGARAVLVGRAYAYGLGAAGEAGVARALEILRTDLVRTLKLLGCGSVAALDRSYVDVPARYAG
ncbi:MAG: alpha-hydroxy-acid oxidizing protein [Bacillati bacterium ANGP1]|uniref:Alpha-hydroxy-acid oxidizing protein n=1 Tax=Candidatus Segetimicrobium genomatis TaxID=2569760 RepID=A0A537JKC1_9BACT|nr:MAG: alpha-hydroxy-acid oxidizing protein [Terrabacteria group bacterium ANGP1]